MDCNICGQGYHNSAKNCKRLLHKHSHPHSNPQVFFVLCSLYNCDLVLMLPAASTGDAIFFYNILSYYAFFILDQQNFRKWSYNMWQKLTMKALVSIIKGCFILEKMLSNWFCCNYNNYSMHQVFSHGRHFVYYTGTQRQKSFVCCHEGPK